MQKNNVTILVCTLMLAAIGIFTWTTTREPLAKETGGDVAVERWEYKTVEIMPSTNHSEEMKQLLAKSERMHGYPPAWDGRNVLMLHASEMNSLGREGWELVSATPEMETVYPLNGGRPMPNTRTHKIILIYKKKI